MDKKEQKIYGKEQNIKIALMQMINEGRDPYEIILYIADDLEKISGEKGYAENVRECLHAVYGIGLEQKQPLQEALLQTRGRCQKLEKAAAGVDDESTKKRILFAVEHHKKMASFLEEKIKKADTK